MNEETGFIGLAKLPQPVHLRQLLGITDEYVRYCREERNFAAVLYHLLLDTNRLRSFLKLTVQDADAVAVEDVRIYFEYAHLRDLWTAVAVQEKTDVEAKNERYRAAIVAMLRMPTELERELSTVKAFNEFFTGLRAGAASATHIQMPSRWSNSQFGTWSEAGRAFGNFGGLTFKEQTFAEQVCSVKWAFNAKPDLVLHLGNGKAICIEAKLESGAGNYQVKPPDGCFTKGQLELQEFILTDLLGYDTDFLIISKKKTHAKTPWRSYSWHEVFGALLKGHSSPESRMVEDFCASRLVNP